MPKFFALMLGLILSSSVIAADSGRSDGVLNKVYIKFNQEQWIDSKTALVTVNVNASVSDSGLEQVQDEVLKKLSKIANQAPWHLTSFDRSLDQSGLEKVQITAQVRIPSANLSGIRDRTKAISKPGETFTLDNIQFTPSEEDIRDADTALRQNIYQQAKDEVDRLNKLFPEKKYFVYRVDFVGISKHEPSPGPLPQVYMQSMAVGSNGGGSSRLAVSDKYVLTATVTLAAVTDNALFKSIT